MLDNEIFKNIASWHLLGEIPSNLSTQLRVRFKSVLDCSPANANFDPIYLIATCLDPNLCWTIENDRLAVAKRCICAMVITICLNQKLSFQDGIALQINRFSTVNVDNTSPVETYSPSSYSAAGSCSSSLSRLRELKRLRDAQHPVNLRSSNQDIASKELADYFEQYRDESIEQFAIVPFWSKHQNAILQSI